MAFPRRCILVLTVLVAAAPWRAAAKSAEDRAFEAASSAFRDTIYARAESQFDAFTQTYTNSPRLPEAILFQAEARYKLGNFDGVVELLKARQGQAGKLADEYIFWQAEGLLARGELPRAAETYERLVRDFPGSRRRLEAAVSEAAVRVRLQQWSAAMSLLQEPNGVFQSALRTNLLNDAVLRGYLLLAEAQLAQKDYRAAEATLQPMRTLLLSPEIAWQRQFLVCRIQRADNRLEEALRSSTNLLAFATETTQSNLLAESAALRGDVLERLGRPNEAISAYAANLTATSPAERQRQALLKIAELSLVQNKIADAIQRFDEFLARYPGAAAADLACLTAGELRLRLCAAAIDTTRSFEAVTNDETASNCLEQAAVSFNSLTTQFPGSPYLGRAQFGLGWCYALEGRRAEAESAFEAAVQRLPLSAERAEAFFKLADTQFLETNFPGALANYTSVTEKFTALPEVRTNLVEAALYQVVRVGLAAGNIDACTNALQRILRDYPNGFRTGGAVLLAGQWIGRTNSAAAARDIYLAFAQRATNAALLPEVELAIARTYEQEEGWEAAIGAYDAWLSRFTNSSVQARAEYSRALVNFRAGHETNALIGFTNFIARFPTNEFTPLAEWWVGDFYYGRGDYASAEAYYQAPSLDRPGSEVGYQGLLMAGRCAFARGSADATNYFIKLYKDTNCPAELQAQALFAYGDFCMAGGASSQTNKLSGYSEAISAFDALPRLYPTNPLAVLALGQKANCLLQTHEYTNAMAVYQEVTNSPLADTRARCISKLGIAVVFEAQAGQETGARQVDLLTRALNNYLDVFYDEELLRVPDSSGLFWTKKAGWEAARLAETLKQWSQAANLYQRLEALLPSLRDSLEAKRRQAEKNIPPAAAD